MTPQERTEQIVRAASWMETLPNFSEYVLSHIQEAVLAERQRCVDIILSIRSGIEQDDKFARGLLEACTIVINREE